MLCVGIRKTAGSRKGSRPRLPLFLLCAMEAPARVDASGRRVRTAPERADGSGAAERRPAINRRSACGWRLGDAHPGTHALARLSTGSVIPECRGLPRLPPSTGAGCGRDMGEARTAESGGGVPGRPATATVTPCLFMPRCVHALVHWRDCRSSREEWRQRVCIGELRCSAWPGREANRSHWPAFTAGRIRSNVPKLLFCLGVGVENSSPNNIAVVENSMQNVGYEFYWCGKTRRFRCYGGGGGVTAVANGKK